MACVVGPARPRRLAEAEDPAEAQPYGPVDDHYRDGSAKMSNRLDDANSVPAMIMRGHRGWLINLATQLKATRKSPISFTPS
jgi:hypothetical protein